VWKRLVNVGAGTLIPLTHNQGVAGRVLVGLILAAVLLAGCNGGWFREPRHDGVFVLNQTSTTLRFAVQLPDELLRTGGFAEPGERGAAVTQVEGSPEGRSLRDGCLVGDLVALDLEGREVARHPGPLCLGDTWTITEPLASPPD
jgi:hypothetical protein